MSRLLQPDSVQFICPECNALLPEGQSLKRSGLARKCQRGHLVIQTRPFLVAFFQGLGWGSLAIGWAAIAAAVFGATQVIVLGPAGAVASAFACTRVLDGWKYQKLGLPSSGLSRQRFAEAVGIRIATLLSSFFTAR